MILYMKLLKLENGFRFIIKFHFTLSYYPMPCINGCLQPAKAFIRHWSDFYFFEPWCLLQKADTCSFFMQEQIPCDIRVSILAKYMKNIRCPDKTCLNLSAVSYDHLRQRIRCLLKIFRKTKMNCQGMLSLGEILRIIYSECLYDVLLPNFNNICRR